jgi:hypothetical protein
LDGFHIGLQLHIKEWFSIYFGSKKKQNVLKGKNKTTTDLNREIMASKDTLSAKREEANKIVNEILHQFEIIEGNVLKSNELLNSIAINTNDSRNLQNVLNKIISTTNDAISKFKVQRDNVSKLLSQVNSFYTKRYQPLVKKINDRESGFQTTIQLTNKTKNEILKLKQLSQEQYDIIKNYALDLRKKNRELISIDRNIRKLLDDVTSKSQKVNDSNKVVASLENQTKKIYESITRLYTSGLETEEKISILLTQSQAELDSIKLIKEESSQLLNEIRNIYEIAAETGLSGEFDKRRAHLKELLIKWEKRIFITTIILFGIIVLMFVCQLWLYDWDIKEHTFDINFYIRFLIASPVVYYLYFCTLQYSQAKSLHDKYSFKTTLAMSIRSHIQLLTMHEKFGNEERINKILDFVIEGFHKIYSEPHIDDDFKVKLKIANMELEIEKKIIEAINKTISVSEKLRK